MKVRFLNDEMNTQLVESIYQVIQSLSDEERSLLKQKLFTDLPYPLISFFTNFIG
jgi:hypothetical protein